MKTLILAISFIFMLSLSSFGQYTFMTNIQGQTGIDVDVTITFNQIIVNSNDCSNGFNYQIQFDYDVHYNQFGNGNGNNDLNTLQGYLACGPGNQSYFNLPNGGGMGSGLTANNWTPLNDCQNIQVQDLMCDMIDLVFQGPGIGYQTVTLEAISTLPVTFIDFSGKQVDKSIYLEWSTASEKNNDFFKIERSVDGKDWENWKTIDGAGTTSELSSYSLEDNAVIPVVYYRLSQTDYDGTTTQLKTISVENTSNIELIAYPNPATTTITVEGINHLSDLRVIDVTGTDHSSTIVINTLPNNKLKIDIHTLNTGVYFIKTTRDQFRFIKN